ncbi:hypothetical protein M9434_000262 [Picochlorum sp. BPE23]|nr:hypothetical protein M9434_000262 [Picochlorum sp. BPE23]KAI8106292.1 hypothetical protein M9435_000838 [Picochlorum sp. BPE23]
MDNDPNAPPTAKKVGKASNAESRSPNDPQWWLAGSVHPYAPFVGNALKWESYVYDDGSTYEGTMLLDVPHGKGTIVFGNGFGGGIQRPEKNDKYEGEFDTGFAHGLAQYTHTSKGKLFKGEYNVGQRHGCGAEYDMSPFLKKVKGGMDPSQAWEETKDTIESKAKYGTWLRDAFFTGPDESGRWCHIKEITGTVKEVDEVVEKVRMFQYKPDGEVTLRFARDAKGFPAPLMQDPVHYPHGSAFLAPGPLGLCHSIPNDSKLKNAMSKAAAVQQHIHDMYNIPENPEPGSILEKAMKLWKKKQARKQKALEKKLQREMQRIRRTEAAVADDEGAASADIVKEEASPQVEEEEIDDDDLIAFSESGQGSNGPSIVASASVGLSRAVISMQKALHAARIKAPRLPSFSSHRNQ